MLSRVSLLSLLFAGNSLAAGITNVVSTQIVPTDTCGGWPIYYGGPGIDIAGPFYFSAASATNSSVDGLNSFTNSNTSPQTVDLIVNPLVARGSFACNDGVISDYGSTETNTIFYSGDQDNQQLAYIASGARLEIYSVAVDGVGLDGTYLGLGNVTTWGFTFVPGPGGAGSEDTYTMRLLGADTTLGDDEVEGFLSVVRRN
jgi:hypothetical protein